VPGLTFPLAAAVRNAAQIRALESLLASDMPPHVLMLHAAQSATRWLLAHVALKPKDQRIVVLCGPGNNGGDGALIAAALQSAGFTVQVVRFEAHAPPPSDAQFAWQQCEFSSPEPKLVHENALSDNLQFLEALAPQDLIVDAVLGLGQNRAPSASIQRVLNWANQQPAARVAIDVPTGLNPATGQSFDNATGTPFCAHITLTFIAPKLGLLTGSAASYTGEVYLDTLGVPLAANQTDELALVLRPDPAILQRLQRQADSHKGSHGGVLVVGGAPGTLGALLLAGRAALACGAGRVWLSSLTPSFEFDAHEPALMNLKLSAATLAQCPANVVLVGPGLGQDKLAQKALLQILAHPLAPALVIDADALNWVAQDKKLAKLLAQYAGPKVLTPHPQEAARLLGLPSAQAVQADRANSARRLSQTFNAVAVLKGNGSLVCWEGTVHVLPVGNPLLATAGTGDVLSGLIAALMAQGLSAVEAAQMGVMCHGLAASSVQKILPACIGLSATELIAPMRLVLNRLVCGLSLPA
jgi:ADP-dependent NAD(P)H-hydrate dehydratase / NAD(P)H-hydrate epimerase